MLHKQVVIPFHLGLSHNQIEQNKTTDFQIRLTSVYIYVAHFECSRNCMELDESEVAEQKKQGCGKHWYGHYCKKLRSTELTQKLVWWSRWWGKGGWVSTWASLLQLRWQRGEPIMSWGESPCRRHPGLSCYKSHSSERVSRARVFMWNAKCSLVLGNAWTLEPNHEIGCGCRNNTWYLLYECFKGPILYPFSKL